MIIEHDAETSLLPISIRYHRPIVHTIPGPASIAICEVQRNVASYRCRLLYNSGNKTVGLDDIVRISEKKIYNGY